jgi:pilus assembly protein CpaC
MNDGESFAIGGLIKSNASGTIKALPGVGEVPVLGALFRSTSFQQDRTELVFIITAHLVKPAQTAANYPLPTDSFKTPNEADVILMGNMEGRGAAANAMPVPSTQAPAAPAPAPAQQAPAPAPAAAPAPALAPVVEPKQAPRESAVVRGERTITGAAPVPVTVTTPLPEPQASAPAAPADELAARVARVEAAAAQIAAGQRQQYEKPRSSSAPVQN